MLQEVTHFLHMHTTFDLELFLVLFIVVTFAASIYTFSKLFDGIENIVEYDIRRKIQKMDKAKLRKIIRKKVEKTLNNQSLIV